jgi:YfiH family protein
MIIEEIKGLRFYSFANSFKSCDVKHFITSRSGGVSKSPYQSLNIGYGTDDFSLAVLENRLRMAEAIDIPIDYFVMCNQVHGTHVQVVSKIHKGKGALYKDNSLFATDAMITNEPEICLFVQGADCVPILFYDPIKKVIGAAHAGWRGTLKKIVTETLQKMKEIYSSDPSYIQVGIGPSIGQCCYNVGAEVIDEVLRTFGTTDNFITFDNKESVARFDLWYTNKHLLIEAGVKPENIDVGGICTQCRSDEFFSSRTGKGVTGRFGAGIMLNY